MQLCFVQAPPPQLPETIDLRCADVGWLLREFPEVDAPPSLVVADPPWAEYKERPGVAAPDEKYPCLKLADIQGHLKAAARVSMPGARMAVWITGPLLFALCESGQKPTRLGEWHYVSMGFWSKVNHCGVGQHWRGNGEPVLLYRKKRAPCHWGKHTLSNTFTSPPEGHSMKPAEWMAHWLLRWTRPDNLVFDLYAGLGSVALACAWTGRRYLGCEIDPVRHRKAVDRLAIHAAAPPMSVLEAMRS